jgi:hypothetical protein
MARKKLEKKTGNDKSLSCVVKILGIIVVIGLIATITLIIHERIQFLQVITSAASHRNPANFFNNLAHLLEAYNKSVTTEFLSLLYTLIATIAFAYGLTIISKFHEDAQETKKDLAEIRDKENLIKNTAFFSRLQNKLNMGLCIAVAQKTYHVGRYSVWLTTLVENLQDCEKNFPIWEIERKGKIDTFSQRGLRDILSMIQDILTSIQQDMNDINSSPTPGGAAENDQILIKEAWDVCEIYLRTLRSLKINDQFPE